MSTAATPTLTTNSAIAAKLQALNQEATADGSSVQDYLGATYGDVFSPKPGAVAQYFERGMISVLNGRASAVYGAIYLHYRELGGPSGFLGLPISDETPSGSGRLSAFENGDILWSANTGAHEIHGAIRERYNAIGGAQSPLGLPLSDEQAVLSNGKEVGRFNLFTNSAGIWWTSATGAWEVYGAIGEKWREFGGAIGAFGFPTSGETNTPDAGGRYNNFVNGVIVWHPSGPYSGAWPVFDLNFYLEQFESNFDPYHVQIKVDYLNPTANHDSWFPSDSSYATNPRPELSLSIPRVQHDTILNVWLDGLGHHAIGEDERLGIFQAKYDITNLWGLLDQTNPHHANQNINSSFHFNITFNLQTKLPNQSGSFTRTTQWWPFHNFTTGELSYDQMAQTFTDVHEDESTIWHPFDSLFYSALYKSCAKTGNCFGMCLEALYARHARSIFPEPVFNNPYIKYPPGASSGQSLNPASEPDDNRFTAPINIKHGYQIGSSAVDWVFGKFISGSLHDPVSTFNESQNFYNSGDFPILSLTAGGIGSAGHAVTPYAWDSTQKPWRIFVANPNSPATAVPSNDDTTNVVFIDPDANTFSLQVDGGAQYKGGKNGGGMIMALPFHLFSNQPSTPFWEAVELLAVVSIILIAGDAGTAQLSDGNGLSNNAAPILLFNPQNPAAPFDARILHHSPPFRRAGQTNPVPDLDDKSLQVIHKISPSGSGSYSWGVGGPGGMFVANITGPSASDTIRIDRCARVGQTVTISTSAASAKVGSVSVAGGPKDPNTFKLFELSGLQIHPAAEVTMHVENNGSQLIVQNTGAATQVGLSMQSGTNAANKAVRSAVPLAAGSVTRLTPTDWSAQGITRSQVSLELLDKVGGKVISASTI